MTDGRVPFQDTVTQSAYHGEFGQLVGQAVGDYRIEGFLGAGGQGIVLQACSVPTGVQYALKVFGLEKPLSDSLSKGLSEAKKQASVKHDAVVRVHTPGTGQLDFKGDSREVLYIPFEFSSLGDCNRTPPFAKKSLVQHDLEILANLLEGLRAIHDSDITHNDIKPANVMKFESTITYHDGDDFVSGGDMLKITDFGIAKVKSALGMQTGEPSGATLMYMSPEQLDKGYSNAGDVYSMGATLYYMTTGEHPILLPQGWQDTPREWQRAHKELPRPNALDMNPGCPPRLALLLMRMMSPNPDDRPDLNKCREWLATIIDYLRGLALGFRVNTKGRGRLQTELEKRAFPIRAVPEFRSVFHPDVYATFGVQLHIMQMRMDHPVLAQFGRLVEYFMSKFADCFSLYETWGEFDVHAFVWFDPARAEQLKTELERSFPRARVKISRVDVTTHLHGKVGAGAPAVKRSPLFALAIQELTELQRSGLKKTNEFNEADYVVDEYPEESPINSVRVFSFISSLNPPNPFVRSAIVHNVRDTIHKLSQERYRGKDSKLFPRITLMQLAPSAEGPIALVDFVCREFGSIYRLPTSIIELAPDAVTTATFIETRRLAVQSGKLLTP